MNLRRWLTPGIGIKRWLLVVFAGLLLLALAGAHVIRQVTRDVQPGPATQVLIDLITLQFLPYPLRGLLVGLLGGTLAAYGSIRVIRAVVGPIWSSTADQPLVEVIYQKRFLARGPKVVAIGGGTGLSTLLRGLKEHTSNLTAVVTVADDGGSSGVLRTELGIPPVGDIRNCIVALADAEPLMAELLQYRFPRVDAAGEPVPANSAADDPSHGVRPDLPGLGGHAVGNLLIAAMAAIQDGDFEEGVRRMNRVLAVRGQVLPVSPTPMTLHARLRDGSLLEGQSRIAQASDIDRVWLTPDDVAASDDALTAIGEADLIVLGPGSLYTSLLPSLLVPGIRDAVAASSALRAYVCNVATQHGETSGYDLANHFEALVAHTAPGLVDVVLANNHFAARIPDGWHAEPVRLRWPPAGPRAPRLVLDDVVDPDDAHHHDPARLAASLLRVLEREGQRRRTGVARSA
ncbi:MAG: YvcK family protein [Chloroflexota bacterium]|nr:YvcK family protein [Chloroflexota bacterium]